MLIVLSPAKKMDFIEQKGKLSEPKFRGDTEVLIKELKKLSPNDIGKLMKLSDKLSQLNYERYKSFRNKKTKFAAIYTFTGDTYRGLDALSLNSNNLEKYNDKLMILSGLYGILSPFDSIEAYRLEMGTKFSVGDSKNLYIFWRDKLTKYINKKIKKEKFLVNLASKEYSDAVDFSKLEGEVITPIFKDKKGDSYKIISIYAKKARGMMARYIIDNDINDVKGLKKFNYEGYRFSQDESTKDNLVFLRDH